MNSFHVDDFEVIANVTTDGGVNEKLLPKFKGPYTEQEGLPNNKYVGGDTENFLITV